MKILTLLLFLFLLGCEKRAVDPELEEVRAWLLSEEGQTEIANDALALAMPPELSGILQAPPKSLDQLSVESWTIKRIFEGKRTSFKSRFALFAEGWFFVVDEYRFLLLPGIRITKSEFEDFGDPLPIEKVYEFYGSWIAKETERKANETLKPHE